MNILDKICQLKYEEINFLKKKFKPLKKKNKNQRISQEFTYSRRQQL